jgi:branched-chain amino acid transport system substrate-binding protein
MITSSKDVFGILISAATLIVGMPTVQAETQFKVGAIVPSSGPFAQWGRTNTVALNMLERQIYETGGIKGGKLSIIIYDDGATPADRKTFNPIASGYVSISPT